MMLFAIINFVTSTLGIIGFFCGFSGLIVIGGIMYIIETITGFVTGELRSLRTTLLSSMISIPISLFNGYNVFLGWCLVLCVESIILSIVSVIFVCGFAFMKNRKSTTDKCTNADIKREMVKNVLNGGSLEPVDVSDVIPDDVVNKIIDEQQTLLDSMESDSDELANNDIELSEEVKEDVENKTKNSKFFTFNLLSPIKGHIKEPMEINDSNKELVHKWLDSKTNSVYCFEVYKEGKANYYYTTKEIFDDLKHRLDNV